MYLLLAILNISEPKAIKTSENVLPSSFHRNGKMLHQCISEKLREDFSLLIGSIQCRKYSWFWELLLILNQSSQGFLQYLPGHRKFYLTLLCRLEVLIETVLIRMSTLETVLDKVFLLFSSV